MVALVGIARAVVSMTVSASDAATVADKVGATLILEAVLTAALSTAICYSFPLCACKRDVCFCSTQLYVPWNPVVIAVSK